MSSVYYDERDHPKSTSMNAEHVFIDEDCLVVPDGFVFPKICLVTGSAVDSTPRQYKFKRTVDPLSEEAIFSKIAVPNALKVVAAVTAKEKKPTVSFCLSREIVRRRNGLVCAFAVLFISAFVLPVVMLALTDDLTWFILFPPLLIGGLWASWKSGRFVWAKKVTPSFVWLAGIHPAVRDEIYQAGLNI
ncbi:MAG TPA: hypothetical protein VHD62_16180 [Opitutaceae bacterium]|nr:hypothetical protein [Opitutaceae bacterium]